MTDLVEQAELFGCDVNTSVLLGGKSYLHTGSTVSSDERAAAEIIGLASMGWSLRKIAEKTGHSRNTVAMVARMGEKGGKLEPLGDRLRAQALDAVHSDVELGNSLAEQVRTCGGMEARERMVSSLAALRRSCWVGIKDLAGVVPGQVGAAVQVNVTVQGAAVTVEEYAGRLRSLGVDCESDKTSPIARESGQLYPAVCPVASDPGTGTRDAGTGAGMRDAGTRGAGAGGGGRARDGGPPRHTH